MAGEHTRAILAELGYDAQAVASLEESRAVLAGGDRLLANVNVHKMRAPDPGMLMSRDGRTG